jgi:hypothetical protein
MKAKELFQNVNAEDVPLRLEQFYKHFQPIICKVYKILTVVESDLMQSCLKTKLELPLSYVFKSLDIKNELELDNLLLELIVDCIPDFDRIPNTHTFILKKHTVTITLN